VYVVYTTLLTLCYSILGSMHGLSLFTPYTTPPGDALHRSYTELVPHSRPHCLHIM
jgi:hypothetical protein